MDKKLRFIEAKSIDDVSKVISAYVSTYDWDRMNERFVKGAWQLDNYRKAPVVLWTHNYEMPPIAKAIVVNEDDKGLYAEMQFDLEDTFAMKVFSLFKRGFLNSFSVGFRPIQYKAEPIQGASGDNGIVWTNAELLEFSAVPVPANPNAVMSRGDAEMVVKACPNFRIKEIEGKDEVQIEEALPAENTLPETPADDTTVKEIDIAVHQDAFEKSIKALIEMAKTVKGQKMDENKLALVKLSLASLNDIIMENTNQVSIEEFNQLKEIVAKISDYLKNNQPNAQDLVAKFMNQFELALKGYRGE